MLAAAILILLISKFNFTYFILKSAIKIDLSRLVTIYIKKKIAN